MNPKAMLPLTIGLLALVMLVMPSATAKFSLQHRFVNGSGVDCTTCHPSVHSEITSNNVHTTHGFATNPCKGCHIPSYADGDVGGLPSTSPYYNPYQGDTGRFHAAALVECTFCHFNNPECSTCHTKANVTAEFENSLVEAHRPLYWRTKNASGVDTSDQLRSTNEACIACHTQAANVTIIQPVQYLNITANFSDCNEGTDPNCYSGWNLLMDIS